jgi:hypothetical protein
VLYQRAEKRPLVTLVLVQRYSCSQHHNCDYCQVTSPANRVEFDRQVENCGAR